jgi:hypothetical protein
MGKTLWLKGALLVLATGSMVLGLGSGCLVAALQRTAMAVTVDQIG